MSNTAPRRGTVGATAPRWWVHVKVYRLGVMPSDGRRWCVEVSHPYGVEHYRRRTHAEALRWGLEVGDL